MSSQQQFYQQLVKKSNFVGVKYKQQLTMYYWSQALNPHMAVHPDMHIQIKYISAQNTNVIYSLMITENLAGCCGFTVTKLLRWSKIISVQISFDIILKIS